jgi:hypothetical protein
MPCDVALRSIFHEGLLWLSHAFCDCPYRLKAAGGRKVEEDRCHQQTQVLTLCLLHHHVSSSFLLPQLIISRSDLHICSIVLLFS